jgi:phosphotriesterase-related protein
MVMHMGNKVQTVTGAIEISELRNVLMHEHLKIGYTGWHLDALAPSYVKEDVMNKAVDRLVQLKSYGVNCIVDPCPMELGRDPEFMAEVSIRSGVLIVCSTGFDLEERGHLLAIRKLSSEQIEEIYLKEIQFGIGETGIRPGIIKAATGYNTITPYEDKCLTAAGRASQKTNLPIITHTEKGTMGLEQLQLFKKQGVNPGKCLIGHCCANHDLSYHSRIMDEGALVGFDRFGNEFFTKDSLRLGTICGLIYMGYADQLIISTDSVCSYLGRTPYESELTKNWHPSYIFETVIPMLMERGVKEQDIQAITSENPKRYFSIDNG